MVNARLTGLFLLVVLLVSSCSTQDNLAFEKRFAAFKALFIEDGRVIDSGNNNVSHSEGQGYGMLFAVAASDKVTFDALWHWTKQTLQRDDNLFSWRFRPCESNNKRCIDDPNNASDGELLIAWALLRAYEKWGDSSYKNDATAIVAAVEEKLIVTRGTYTVLLPGEFGFTDANSVQLNLSYWVFPAISTIAQYSNSKAQWESLFSSGISLLQESQFSSHKLPSDWLRLEEGNVVSLNNVLSPEYGFNAVRVPLHLAWSASFMKDSGQAEQLLSPYFKWWAQSTVPATLNLNTGESANYGLTPGMTAIKTAVTSIVHNEDVQLTHDEAWPSFSRKTDYYSASLTMLSMLAVMDSQS